MKCLVGSLLLLLCSVSLLANGQHHYPAPPIPMDQAQLPQSHPSFPVQRIDPRELQREARELADLAQSIPADIDKVSQGLLPKDTSDKLKRVEKLAKRLRGAVGR